MTLVHVSDDGEASEVEADIADGGSGVSSVSFDTDSLSLYVFATNADVKAGTSRSVASILGRAQYYGITANKVTLNGHVDSNMAVGELNTNNNRKLHRLHLVCRCTQQEGLHHTDHSRSGGDPLKEHKLHEQGLYPCGLQPYAG